MEQPIHFLDVETTGLDSGRHVVWEIGIVSPIDTEGRVVGYEKKRFVLELSPEELKIADPGALRINKFYDKYRARPLEDYDGFKDGNANKAICDLSVPLARRNLFAFHLASTLQGVLAGNLVSFDALFLNKFMRKHGTAPAWDHRLLDVKAFAAGALGLKPPWKSEDLGKRLGVAEPQGDERHTALADAMWSRDIYLAALDCATRS